MVCLLKLVHIFDVGWHHVALPLQVIIILIVNHYQSRVFAAVDDRVVDVRVVADLERHEEVFDLLALEDPYPRRLTLDLHIRRVLEKGDQRPVFINGLQKLYVFRVRLKHAVWEAAFFALDKSEVQRVCLQIGIHFLVNRILICLGLTLDLRLVRAEN